MSTIILKNIEMTLDPESIDHAIRELRYFETGLKSAMDALCKYLLEYGVTVARINLMRFGAMRTGALYHSIQHSAFDPNTGVGYITAGEGLYAGGMAQEGSPYPIMSYAVFVEFGTGTMGENSQHPMAKRNHYKYDRNKNIIGHAESRKQFDFPGWVYFNEQDNHFYCTRGQPPKPFMYNTLLDLKAEADRNGANIIAQYIP